MADDDDTPASPPSVPAPTAAGAEITRLAGVAADYAERSQSSATRRAYDSAWRAFNAWCDDHQATALPAHPDVVAVYLADRAQRGARKATLAKIIAAIGDAHRRADAAPPASARLTEIWSGIRRADHREPRQAAALATADLRRVVARLPQTTAGARDRAFLLVGFAAALRGSEIVALQLADGAGESAANRCGFVAGGLRIRLGATKTDQEGVGAVIAIPRGKTKLCPVTALRAWLDLSQISGGPIFRPVDRHGRIGQTALSGRAVADIVKRAVSRAGLDPLRFSGHSLRAGFVTSAAIAGVTTELIMRQTRHKKAETVAMYVREAELFSRNAASKVGL